MSRRSWTATILALVVVIGSTGVPRPVQPGDSAIAGPAYQPPIGGENSSVLLFNAGDEAANVVLSYYAPSGAYVTGDACPGSTGGGASCTQELEPEQIFRFDQFYNPGLGEDYRGSGTLAADQPLETLVIKNIEDKAAGNPPLLSYAIENAPAAAYERVGLPFVPNAAGGFSSRFTVQNTSDRAAACVVITYRDNRGGPITSPPSGEKPNEGRCPNGGWSVLPLGTLVVNAGSKEMPTRAGFAGGAFIDSVKNADGDRPEIVAEADVFEDGGRQFDSYSAHGLALKDDGSPDLLNPADDFARTVMTPLIQKQALDGPGTPWTTRVRLLAGDSRRAFNVSARYIGSGDWSGRRFSCRLYVRRIADDSKCRIPIGFTGYAFFRSPVAIAALVERSQVKAGAYARYAVYRGYANAVQNPKELDLPLVTADYWSGWTSRVRIVSLDGVAPTFDIELIPRLKDSCIKERLTKRIRADEPQFTLNFGARGRYSPWPDGSPGGCFYGALRIKADRPIVAVSSLTLFGFRGDIEAMYSALPRPE